MSKRNKIILIALGVLLTLLVLLEAFKPKPINWFGSFSKEDKIPFGTFVFYDQLNKIVDADRLQEVKIPPYEFLMDSTETGSTYFFLNGYMHFGDAEAKRILDWVDNGNTIFISSSTFDMHVLDTINASTQNYYKLNAQKNPLVNLSNPELKSNKAYKLRKDVNLSHFIKLDTTNATILGVADFASAEDSTKIKDPKINFIKMPYGKGEIILHTFPYAFTNYFLLDENNAEYTSKVLGYLPKSGTIYLDQHYKAGKAINSSPLYIIFNNRYLKWAYYILLIGVMLWVFFKGKREQRYIPIIKALPNQTVDFTKTIAGMYLEKKDNKSIAAHLINHFLEHVRHSYNISTERLDKDFIDSLSAKAIKPQEQVKRIVDTIILVRQKNTITEDELIRLNALIEKFKTPA